VLQRNTVADTPKNFPRTIALALLIPRRRAIRPAADPLGRRLSTHRGAARADHGAPSQRGPKIEVLATLIERCESRDYPTPERDPADVGDAASATSWARRGVGRPSRRPAGRSRRLRGRFAWAEASRQGRFSSGRPQSEIASVPCRRRPRASPGRRGRSWPIRPRLANGERERCLVGVSHGDRVFAVEVEATRKMPQIYECQRSLEGIEHARHQKPQERWTRIGSALTPQNRHQRGQVGDRGPGYTIRGARLSDTGAVHQPKNGCGGANDRAMLSC
jgi:hypothetical protein